MLCSVNTMLPLYARLKKSFIKSIKSYATVINKNLLHRIANDVPFQREIEKKLTELELTYTTGPTCYRINDCDVCPIKATLNSGTKRLFINKKTGHFLCQRCKSYGDWYTFLEVLKRKGECDGSSFSNTKNKICYDKTYAYAKLLSECSSVSTLKEKEFAALQNNFNVPYLSQVQGHVLDIRFSKEKNILYFPIFDSGTMVGLKTLTKDGSSTTYPKTDCPSVVLYPGTHFPSTVIVVSDIRDLLALGSLKLQMDVVCLPYGSLSLPQNSLPHLEHYKKVILWLGVEFGALHTSLLFAKKLDEKRCYLIRPTRGQTSPMKSVLNNENVPGIISAAKPIWHQFVVTFNSLREDVLSELQNKKEANGFQWKRFPKLNEILKGHRRGELTIITGPTGSGKTTFMSEYSLDLAMNGVNTLWGSFEIKNSRLMRTMLKQFSRAAQLEDINVFNKWADKFETLPLHFLTFHGQHLLKTVMDAVDHCSYIYDIAHVVIDNVQFMIDVSKEFRNLDRIWTQDIILQSFRRFASKNDCHVTLVMHPRKELDGADLSMNSIFGSVKAVQEADNILILQEKKLSPNCFKKEIQVVKNRFSGDLGSMPLEFDKNTLCFITQNTSEKFRDNSMN